MHTKSKPIAKRPTPKPTPKPKPVLLKKNDPPPDLPEQDEPEPEEPIADEPEPETEEVLDEDPMPAAPIFSGKDEDFPSWRQADMRHKEKLGEWQARRGKR